jgi:ATP-binding cassette subfamily F protein 3
VTLLRRADQTTLDSLVEADADRLLLLKEQDFIESQLESGVDLEANAKRLGDIVAELDAINADGAEDRAFEILKGLSFTPEMIQGPTANLSGGWRMRLALAQTLFIPHSDLILLDECTNHLDLEGVDWLIQYFNTHSHTLMVVSHDRSFLDAICTDIVVMEHQRLTYHVGNYSEYQRQIQAKAARESQILDASERQRNKAIAFVQKQQTRKNSSDPNKQRQAKSIKEKKLSGLVTTESK